MRVSLLPLAVALFILLQGTGARAQTALTANLSIGSRGPQVIVLQKALNQDTDTRIAESGPGSLGNETNYFGSLTRAAVTRFQEKYASDVLAPAGLVRGNGYVGVYTRAKLNTLSATLVGVLPAIPTQPIATPTPAAPQNPNLKNLDTFLAAIDTVSSKHGLPASEIATIKKQVAELAATTTDLRAVFLKKVVQDNPTQSLSDNSLIGRIFASVHNLFRSEKARAAAGTPFGGPLAYSFYCNCSNTWLLTIGPLPPTYVTLLDYIPGSQAYLSYNIPATQWLLGEYTGGNACYIVIPKGCAQIPSEGVITPTVGSS